MPQSYSSLHVHIVFSTKGREPLIRPELTERLYRYLGGIARQLAFPAIAIGGMPDHVHLLIDLSRERTVAEAVRHLKASSSKWIRQEQGTHRGFAWQTGYGAFAVSRLNLQEVRRYIADSQNTIACEHFRRSCALLERHGIEFDERYLWT